MKNTNSNSSPISIDSLSFCTLTFSNKLVYWRVLNSCTIKRSQLLFEHSMQYALSYIWVQLLLNCLSSHSYIDQINKMHRICIRFLCYSSKARQHTIMASIRKREPYEPWSRYRSAYCFWNPLPTCNIAYAIIS